MYCENCGAKLNDNDRFCGECGAPVITAAPQLAVTSTPSLVNKPRSPMSRKAKLATGITAGVIVLAGAAYSILHFTYGPSSPEKLEKKLQAAVASHNVDKFLSYLDHSNETMRTKETVKAFQKAFNEEIASGYKYYVAEALDDARDALEDGRKVGDPDSGGPIYFVKEKSWRGTKWSFNVSPAEVTFEQGEGWEASGSLETLESKDGTFKNLWPAIYSYQADIKNEYGGKESVQGSVDVLSWPSEEVSFWDSLDNEVSFYVPDFEGVSFKLNDVELPKTDEYDSLTIAPVPEELNLKVEGTYLGKPIEQTAALNVEDTDTDSYELDALLQQAVAEQVADLLLSANVSWTKAYNAQDTKLLTDVDPDGDAYDTFTWDISGTKEYQQVRLNRIAIVPADIEISEDEILVTATEEYSYPGSEMGNNTTSTTYVITQKPDQDSWWITSASPDYYYGDDLFESENNLVKTNTEK